MKYAVAYVNFFDNDLQIAIVQASNWKEALAKTFIPLGLVNDLPKTLEEAKEEAFNQDWLFTVKEI